MHPVVLQDPASQPWTMGTVSLAVSAVVMIAVLMLCGEAFASLR
jgi:hypothetical protein